MKRMHLFAPIAMGLALIASPLAAQQYANLGSSLFGDYVRETDGADDAEADFNGEADFARGRLCYYLEIEGLDDPSAIAIHQGGERENGAEVLALTFPAENGDEACVTADAALLRTISEAPDGYYVLIRSTGHPDGALRGQLHD